MNFICHAAYNATVAVCIAGLVGALPGVSAARADSVGGRIGAELNKVESVDGGCRMTLVLTNGLETPVERLTFETVLFDDEGTVVRFLLLNARPLPPGRTRVQQFDIDGISCDGLGRVLLNDVTACEGEGLDPAGCFGAVEVTSRTDVPFDGGD